MKQILWFARMQLNRLIKPTAVHTEAIHIDRVWKEIKKYARKNNATWFVVTPVNFGFAKHTFGFKGTKKEYEKILVKRYRWLQKHGQRIQLHLHLRYFLDTLTDDKKLKMLLDAFDWMIKHGFTPTEIVFGWWIWPEICSIYSKWHLGLRVVRYFDYYWFHDYDFMEELIQR